MSENGLEHLALQPATALYESRLEAVSAQEDVLEQLAILESGVVLACMLLRGVLSSQQELAAGLHNVQAVLSKSTYSDGAVALAALQRRMSAAQHRVAAVEVRAIICPE